MSFGKAIRKNNDSIGIIITNYEISENGYDTAAFHEYKLEDVDNILMSTTWDHYSNEETTKAELMRSERTIDSKLQRKYALIDKEFAKSIIFSYCKESLVENDLMEDYR